MAIIPHAWVPLWFPRDTNGEAVYPSSMDKTEPNQEYCRQRGGSWGGAASFIKPDEYDAQDKQKSIWWSQEGRSRLVNMLATCFRFGSDGGRNLCFWWPCFDEFVLPPAGYSVPWKLFRFGCFKRYSKNPEYNWMNFPLFIWLQGTGERIWKHMLVTVQWLVLGSM